MIVQYGDSMYNLPIMMMLKNNSEWNDFAEAMRGRGGGNGVYRLLTIDQNF